MDVILETTGGEVVDQALTALAVFGRMIYIGQSSGQPASVDLWRLTAPNHTISGLYIVNYAASAGLVMTTLTELLGLVMTGKVTIQIGTTLPLSQAAEVHRMLEERKNIEKIILHPWA